MSIPWELVEPRCHLCQDPLLRWRANELLDWVGIPLPLEGRQDRVTIADVHRDITPAGYAVSYTALWNHARRHHSIEGINKRVARSMSRTFIDAVGISRKKQHNE